MPVYPLIVQPPRKLGAYPHMARRDAALWERFLDTFGADFDGFAYDVALGGLIPDAPGVSAAELLGWRYSTAAKIDAVAFRPDEVWLIEVKPSAGFSAFGQLLAYLILAELDGFTTLPLVPVLVTDTTTPDVQTVAAELGIEIVTIEEPPPEAAP